MNKVGTISLGLKLPLIKEGDDLMKIILSTLEDIQLDDGDILGITESVLARSQGDYCTKEDIIADLKLKYGYTDTIVLFEPIASRNRFSFILSSIASAFKKVIIIWQNDYDEVGNVVHIAHPFTGIVYDEYYRQLVESAGTQCQFDTSLDSYDRNIILDCRCHIDKLYGKYSLGAICNHKSIWGLLGSNVCGENKLKLFPNGAHQFCNELKQQILIDYVKNVDVIVYGDGCFKDPVGGIWEFADPVTCPGSTIPDNRTPHEFKLKYLIDTVHEDGVKKAFDRIKQDQRESHMGTTPRRVIDLLASLMDLTSGSGSKGTPMVLIKNYWDDYYN